MTVVDSTRIEGNKATLSVWGRISVGSAHDMDDAICALPESVRDIDLDISRVSYISSAALRAFMKASKLCNGRNGKLRLLYPRKEVDGVFQMTSLDVLVEIVRGGND